MKKIILAAAAVLAVSG
ncbi:lipoprotein, partial [Mesorhizobium sp. BR1-1-9]|nr:lipoprotein [Mesorhizobium sp. BR1-1-9]